MGWGKVCLHINLILAVVCYYVHSVKWSASYWCKDSLANQFHFYVLSCIVSFLSVYCCCCNLCFYKNYMDFCRLSPILWFCDSQYESLVLNYMKTNWNLRRRTWEKAVEVCSSSQKQRYLGSCVCMCPGRSRYIFWKHWSVM